MLVVVVVVDGLLSKVGLPTGRCVAEVVVVVTVVGFFVVVVVLFFVVVVVVVVVGAVVVVVSSSVVVVGSVVVEVVVSTVVAVVSPPSTDTVGVLPSHPHRLIASIAAIRSDHSRFIRHSSLKTEHTTYHYQYTPLSSK